MLDEAPFALVRSPNRQAYVAVGSSGSLVRVPVNATAVPTEGVDGKTEIDAEAGASTVMFCVLDSAASFSLSVTVSVIVSGPLAKAWEKLEAVGTGVLLPSTSPGVAEGAAVGVGRAVGCEGRSSARLRIDADAA